MAPTKPGGSAPHTPVKDRLHQTAPSSSKITPSKSTPSKSTPSKSTSSKSAPRTPAKTPTPARRSAKAVKQDPDASSSSESRRVKLPDGVMRPDDLENIYNEIPEDMFMDEDTPSPKLGEEENDMMDCMQPESDRLGAQTDRAMREQDEGETFESYMQASGSKQHGGKHHGGKQPLKDDSEAEEDSSDDGDEYSGSDADADSENGGDSDDGLLGGAKKPKAAKTEKVWMNSVGKVVRINPDNPEEPTALNSARKALRKTKSGQDPNGRFIGRHLVNWHRPRMMEKLVLCMQFECHKAGIQLPWDHIVHRLNPGSSGAAALQMLNKMREVLIREGHFIPPQMVQKGQHINPLVRGYVRDFTQDDPRASRTLLWTEPFENAKYSLNIDGILTGSGSHRKIKKEENGRQPADVQTRSSRTTRVRYPSGGKTALPSGSIKKSRSRIKKEATSDDDELFPEQLDPDDEWSPIASRLRRRRRRRTNARTQAVASEDEEEDNEEEDNEEEEVKEPHSAIFDNGDGPSLVVRLPIAIEEPYNPGDTIRLASTRRKPIHPPGVGSLTDHQPDHEPDDENEDDWMQDEDDEDDGEPDEANEDDDELEEDIEDDGEPDVENEEEDPRSSTQQAMQSSPAVPSTPAQNRQSYGSGASGYEAAMFSGGSPFQMSPSMFGPGGYSPPVYHGQSMLSSNSYGSGYGNQAGSPSNQLGYGYSSYGGGTTASMSPPTTQSRPVSQQGGGYGSHSRQDTSYGSTFGDNNVGSGTNRAASMEYGGANSSTRFGGGSGGLGTYQASSMGYGNTNASSTFGGGNGGLGTNRAASMGYGSTSTSSAFGSGSGGYGMTGAADPWDDSNVDVSNLFGNFNDVLHGSPQPTMAQPSTVSPRPRDMNRQTPNSRGYSPNEAYGSSLKRPRRPRNTE